MWGHCSFLLVQRHTRFCFCPPRVCFPSPVLSSGGSMVGLMVASSKRAYTIPKSTAPRAPVNLAGHSDPYLRRRYSNTQRQVWLSLCGVSWCAQGFVGALQASLVGMGFDSNAILLLLPSFLGFSFALGPGVSFLVGSNILLSVVFQQ